MRQTDWSRGVRLAASAFFVAAAVGTVACRGNRADKTDYDVNPPAAAGRSTDTMPSTTTSTDTSAGRADANLIPVPGTPHNIRPGVTDTNTSGTVRNSTSTTTTRTHRSTRTHTGTTAGSAMTDTSMKMNNGMARDTSMQRGPVVDSSANSGINSSTTTTTTTDSSSMTGQPRTGVTDSSMTPSPSNPNMSNPSSPSSTTTPSTTDTTTVRPNSGQYQPSGGAQVADTIRADSTQPSPSSTNPR